jgi:fructokinase
VSISCIGELLIDFVCSDINIGLEQGEHFQKKAGGAPANVAVTVSKLGGEALFFGKVGNDPFGTFLKQMLQHNGVITDGIISSSDVPTTLAFVSLLDNGERDFVFHRGADAALSIDEINMNSILQSNIIHFGSATALLGGEIKETYKHIFETAYQARKFLSFDPNFRSDLWKGREQEFIATNRPYISKADLVKVSEEELKLLTGESLEAGVKTLHEWGARIVTVTLGKDGTFLSCQDKHTIVPSISVHAVDSTGAGDTFVGALLFQLDNEEEVKNKEMDALIPLVEYANKAAALTCTRLGAIQAIPTAEEVRIYRA